MLGAEFAQMPLTDGLTEQHSAGESGRGVLWSFALLSIRTVVLNIASPRNTESQSLKHDFIVDQFLPCSKQQQQRNPSDYPQCNLERLKR